MKIFLSYGHDSAAEGLVNRIQADLSALGHDVWLDRDRIDFGDDWRREITDGIIESDQVLAFLSQHSTREPGVCRDEISIALGAGKAYVFTILVQPEQEVDLPLSVSHLQWLDMHDWQQRQQEPEQFEAWYAECLAKIIEVIDHPDNQRFAGEISQLEQYLKPLDCTADIVSRVQKFTGREWLVDELNQWREGDRQSRVFWLSGGPGVGKSAVAAWLAHSNRAQVIAAQFCRYNSPERREPTRVIRSIAFQLATRLPDYRRHLMYQPEIADLDRKNPAELFDYLLANPLRYAINGNRSRHLIVLDALDESLKEGKSELTELIAAEIHKLPDWIGWVVTSRPEAAIRRQLEQFGIHEINADDPRNQQDIASYVDEWLSKRGLVDDERLQTQAKVIEAAQGNFLYLRQLELAVEQNIIDLKQIDDLPKGLSALYAREFGYRFADLSAYEKDILPLLEILVASSRPIPEADIENILNCSKRQRIRLIEQLGSFVNQTPDGIGLFHKSLKDWLVDEASAGADYFVEVDNGHQVLGKVLWEQFTQAEDLVSQLDSFMAKEMPEQLTHWSDEDLLRLISFDAIDQYVEKITEVIELENQPSRHSQQESWGWFGIRLHDLCFGPDNLKTAGFLYIVERFFHHIAQYTDGETLLRRALVIREHNLESEHIDIAKSLNELAILLSDKGSFSEVKTLHERALAIREKLLGPNHVDVAESLNNFAQYLFDNCSHEDFERAISVQKRALEIWENNSESDQQDVATGLSNLALFIAHPGTLEAIAKAKPLCERALLIRENLLGSDHPDVAISLNNLAFNLLETGDLNDWALAKSMYERALAINEQAYGANHPNVALSLNNLALCLKESQEFTDYSDVRSLYERALAIRENIFGSNHPDIAQSLSNLAMYLDKTGNSNDFSCARFLHEKALAIREKVFGFEHSDIADSLCNFANYLTETGDELDFAKARQLYKRSILIREKTLGTDHPHVAIVLDDFACYLSETGFLEDLEVARSLYERALPISEKALGPDHPFFAYRLSNFADFLAKTGDSSDLLKAKKLYERALVIFEDVLGFDHPDTAFSLSKLGGFFQDQGDYAAAEPLLRRALVIFEQSLESDHQSTRNCMFRLAGCLFDLGNLTEAEKFYRLELLSCEKKLGNDDPDTHLSMHSYGVLLLEIGKYEEAELILRKVVYLREKLHGAESLELADSLSALGLTLTKKAVYGEASQLYQRALAISIAVLGEDHEDTMRIKDRIADVPRQLS
jgi:hypothetical protein